MPSQQQHSAHQRPTDHQGLDPLRRRPISSTLRQRLFGERRFFKAAVDLASPQATPDHRSGGTCRIGYDNILSSAAFPAVGASERLTLWQCHRHRRDRRRDQPSLQSNWPPTRLPRMPATLGPLHSRRLPHQQRLKGKSRKSGRWAPDRFGS